MSASLPASASRPGFVPGRKRPSIWLLLPVLLLVVLSLLPLLYVGLKAWASLPPVYQEAITAATADTVSWSVAKYDAQNPKALRELVASGTKFLPFPQSVMEACFNASNELYAETVAKNAKFKKVFEPWKQFRSEQVLWFRVVENTFDNFNFSMSAQGR